MIISFVDNVFVDDGDAVFDDSGVLKEVVGLEAEVEWEDTLHPHQLSQIWMLVEMMVMMIAYDDDDHADLTHSQASKQASDRITNSNSLL